MPAAIPLAIAGSAIGGVATAAIGSKAAGKAADTQAAAANHAADLERQSAQEALGFQKQQYGNSLSLLAPFYNSGVSATNALDWLMGLKPATGLPAGVINPNAPAPTSTPVRGPLFGGGTGPGGSAGDAVLPMSVGGGGFRMENRFNSMVPTMTDVGGPAGNPNSLSILANGGFGPPQFAADPNDPSQTPFPGNPDVGNWPGLNGSITASTNQGGTAQVPRVDGGGATPDSNQVGNNSFGSLAQGWNQTFQAPTDVTEQNDPGWKFRLDQSLKALQNSAAARGGLLTGGTEKALTDFAQNDASNEYQNTYNRALQTYNTNFNTFSNDKANLFNRFATLAGMGQTSANDLSTAGLTTGNAVGNTLLTSAGQIGQQLNNAGAATASGYVGSGNAITSGINGALNNLQLLALLKKQGPGAGGYGV